MDINATLIGQTIAFLVFVLFCYKFIWTPLNTVVEKRQKEIADSLQAAENARSEISEQKNFASLEIEKAKVKAKEIINGAEHQAQQIVEQARVEAQAESQRLIEIAHKDILLEKTRVQQELRQDVAELASQIATKLVGRELTVDDNDQIITEALNNLK